MVEAIQGNISARQKKLCERLLAHFIGNSETSYGAEVGQGLKLTQVDVYSHPHAPRGLQDSLASSHQLLDDTGGSLQGQGEATVKSPRADQIDLEARTVCEITVTKKMCNIHGTLHGGCAMYLMDPCSVSALVALGVVTGVDGTGVSQSMFTQWHRPVTEGTQLNIISTTVATNGYIRSSRCEIRDQKTNMLYVSSVHSIVNVTSKKANGPKL
ncbi:hypothetical protein K435DRAFT_841188 [Dendrothele bispora CBS 962.96]|uniref:Thioesterase domain-containing protein n=1 Tax=Dendrothele bispora (strain CBS 962.96) TaxID=1314807 RepID=A0A4S8LNV2_DENBC|nr:hypothetical protein K435DRAFT_841188 [Dendrothele bispora CBS 962.96]